MRSSATSRYSGMARDRRIAMTAAQRPSSAALVTTVSPSAAEPGPSHLMDVAAIEMLSWFVRFSGVELVTVCHHAWRRSKFPSSPYAIAGPNSASTRIATHAIARAKLPCREQVGQEQQAVRPDERRRPKSRPGTHAAPFLKLRERRHGNNTEQQVCLPELQFVSVKLAKHHYRGDDYERRRHDARGKLPYRQGQQRRKHTDGRGKPECLRGCDREDGEGREHERRRGKILELVVLVARSVQRFGGSRASAGGPIDLEVHHLVADARRVRSHRKADRECCDGCGADVCGAACHAR